MKDFFKELFEYSHHFNQMILQSFAEQPEKIPERPFKLISHIINAQHVWNCRILRNQQQLGIWDVHSLDALKVVDIANHAASNHIVDQYELNDLLHYTNSKGEPFSNSIRDILFHVVNHSTYHRAQIASDMKQAGMESLITDYIFYKR
jgi:uncharacterized damage-inducible protein DinB